MEDTIGLQYFFEANQEKYVWSDRVEANIFTCSDYKVVSKLKRLLWKKNKGMITMEELQESINQDSPLNIQVNSKKFSLGDNKYIDQVKWVKGSNEIKTDSDEIIYLEILNIIPSTNKDLDDTKGKVISDYQNQLEEIWINELRDKYKIEINNDMLYSILK